MFPNCLKSQTIVYAIILFWEFHWNPSLGLWDIWPTNKHTHYPLSPLVTGDHERWLKTFAPYYHCLAGLTVLKITNDGYSLNKSSTPLKHLSCVGWLIFSRTEAIKWINQAWSSPKWSICCFPEHKPPFYFIKKQCMIASCCQQLYGFMFLQDGELPPEHTDRNSGASACPVYSSHLSRHTNRPAVLPWMFNTHDEYLIIYFSRQPTETFWKGVKSACFLFLSFLF